MSTNRYIDKLKARLAKEADQRMQLQALLDDQVARNRAILAERDALRSALERFYNANQARLKLLSREVYLDMQRLPGMRDALYEMDDAQHQAYAALQGAQP